MGTTTTKHVRGWQEAIRREYLQMSDEQVARRYDEATDSDRVVKAINADLQRANERQALSALLADVAEQDLGLPLPGYPRRFDGGRVS